MRIALQIAFVACSNSVPTVFCLIVDKRFSKRKISEIMNFHIIVNYLKAVVPSVYFVWQIVTGRFKSAEVEWALIPLICKDGDVVVDVGANIGRWSFALARTVSSAGRVLAIEPGLSAARTFLLIASTLNYSNVHLLHCGAHTQSSIAHFFERRKKPAGAIFSTNTSSSLTGTDSFDEKFPTVQFALDFLYDLHPSFIKIDVEGAELQVLEGMKKVLQDLAPLLLVEDNDRNSVEIFLQDLQYVPIKINPQSRNIFYSHINDPRTVTLRNLSEL
jgi:FkbM family methyltransferase